MVEKPTRELKFWVNIASLDHANKGVREGFIQCCHGKAAPLKRMCKGDWVIHYSPKEKFHGKTPYKQFTTIGFVADDEIYPFDMDEVFTPWRRKIKFIECKHCPISDLLDKLSFTKNRGKNWGIVFRCGFFEIKKDDFQLIYEKMMGRKFKK